MLFFNSLDVSLRWILSKKTVLMEQGIQISWLVYPAGKLIIQYYFFYVKNPTDLDNDMQTQ